MRVLSGNLKSKRIDSLEIKNLRPTSSRVRQSIFNILLHRFNWLERLNYISILEPFAGTGSVSLEAISRGANKATLIEKDKSIFMSLKENIKKLNLQQSIEIKNIDFFKVNDLKKYNFFFLDPPYYKNLANLALEKIFDEKLILENSIILCETEKNYRFLNKLNNKVCFIRYYGKLKLSFLSVN